MKKSLVGLVLAALMLPAASIGQTAPLKNRAKAGDFDATQEVRCAQEVGETLGTCVAGAAREGLSALIVVKFSNGFSRTLTFEGDQFLRGNATMSGVGTDTDWYKADGIYFIRVDDQRFEIPEALVAGQYSNPS